MIDLTPFGCRNKLSLRLHCSIVQILYSYCDPEYLDTEYRVALVTEELLAYDADVICLQVNIYFICSNFNVFYLTFVQVSY